MRLYRHALATMFASVVLCGTARLDAAFTLADSFDNGNGTISPINLAGNDASLSKTYDSIGPMVISFETIGPGIHTVQEDIVNNTGIDWTDFHWNVFEEIGGVSIIDVDQDVFSNINALPDTMAWVDGGIVPGNGGQLIVTLTVNVTDTIGLWGIGQFPTTDGRFIPEPTSLLIWLPLLFAVSVCWRSRRR